MWFSLSSGQAAPCFREGVVVTVPIRHLPVGGGHRLFFRSPTDCNAGDEFKVLIG